MMFEAIEVISKLFSGKVVKHDGEYFTLESSKLYTRPEQPVPIYVATAGPLNAKRTGRYADGIITVGAADEKIAPSRNLSHSIAILSSAAPTVMIPSANRPVRFAFTGPAVAT